MLRSKYSLVPSSRPADSGSSPLKDEITAAAPSPESTEGVSESGSEGSNESSAPTSADTDGEGGEDAIAADDDTRTERGIEADRTPSPTPSKETLKSIPTTAESGSAGYGLAGSVISTLSFWRAPSGGGRREPTEVKKETASASSPSTTSLAISNAS